MLHTKNKVFIGLIAFAVIVIYGINDFIPASLSALEGESFETSKGTKQVNSQAAWFVFAVLILMAIWWATEVLPVAVTFLLPLALLLKCWIKSAVIHTLIRIFIYFLEALFWH